MKRWVFALLALGFGLVLGPPTYAGAKVGAATSEPMVVVSPSERVELSLSPGATPKEIYRGPPSTALAAYLPAMDATAEKLQPIYGVAPQPKAGELVATLLSNPTVGTRLIVENGYDYPVIYQAFLITVKDGKRSFHPTSICPIRAGKAGVEGWPEPVVGVAMIHIQGVDPANMVCNDGSALSLAPDPAKDDVTYSCDAGKIMDVTAPVRVSLAVDSSGSVREATAAWSLAAASVISQPSLILDYPLMGDVAAPAPNAVDVFVAVGLNPPPTAKSASVHLFLNGEEKVSRPWRLYGQQLTASLAQEGPKRPVAFAGMIPIVPQSPSVPADDGLRALLGGVDQDGAEIEVRILGDDGSVLAHATYKAGASPVHTKSVIDPLLTEASTKAKTLTQCQKRAS